MGTHKLQQTGRPFLEIEGEQLCKLGEPPPKGRRWVELALYRLGDSEGGGFLAHVAYRTDWPDEAPGVFEIREGKSAEDLFDQLTEYDPCDHARLRPERNPEETARNRPQNDTVRRALRRDWGDIIVKAAENLGYVERRGPRRSEASNAPTIPIWARVSEATDQEIERAKGTLSRIAFVRAAVEAYLHKSR